MCLVASQARAGLFSDDEARKQIQQVDTRVSALEDASKKLGDANQQQSHTLLDLQSQIDTLNTELRDLRGQNEELAHGLQDADKRQKDFYIDLDTRVRRFESVDTSDSAQAGAASSVPADDPVAWDRAYEAAHGLLKAGKNQDAIQAFAAALKKYPDSVYVPRIYYEMGTAYFALNDYKHALASYQALASNYSYSPKVPDAMLGIADCQQGLKKASAAKKVLRQIIAKFPDSAAAAEAKKRLAKHK